MPKDYSSHWPINSALKIADEIERNLNLDPPNTAIGFNDVQWALIVKALRAYGQSGEPK